MSSAVVPIDMGHGGFCSGSSGVEFWYVFFHVALSTMAVLVDSANGESQMIGENGTSSSSLVNDGRDDVFGLGRGSPTAIAAVMVGIKQCFFPT